MKEILRRVLKSSPKEAFFKVILDTLLVGAKMQRVWKISKTFCLFKSLKIVSKLRAEEL